MRGRERERGREFARDQVRVPSYHHDSRNHLLFHVPPRCHPSAASARGFVAQLYGNCSLTNRLNPLFSLRGEDNHPARVKPVATSPSIFPSFADPLAPPHRASHQRPTRVVLLFDLLAGFLSYELRTPYHRCLGDLCAW